MTRNEWALRGVACILALAGIILMMVGIVMGEVFVIGGGVLVFYFAGQTYAG